MTSGMAMSNKQHTNGISDLRLFEFHIFRMVYVRTDETKEVPIQEFVRKVRFFLHPSFAPDDIVEVRFPYPHKLQMQIYL
jgi:transcription initiation factor IIF auxiliary subunit